MNDYKQKTKEANKNFFHLKIPNNEHSTQEQIKSNIKTKQEKSKWMGNVIIRENLRLRFGRLFVNFVSLFTQDEYYPTITSGKNL